MSFLIVFIVGSVFLYLFERGKFKDFDFTELLVMSFGLGIAVLIVLGVLIF
ncbi:hypothetical protein KJ785_02855 [Patescibacteria group bacterium]|nr:hypothetical protein [Patescibacteria group bacterium]